MKRAVIALIITSASCATPGAGKYEMSAAGHDAAAAAEARQGSSNRSADHKAAASRLRQDEAQACDGLNANERENSPLLRLSIAAIEPLTTVKIVGPGEGSPQWVLAGATVVVRGDRNLTSGFLQRLLTCHIAHAQLGVPARPAMKDCPLAVPDVSALVREFGPGYEIEITAAEPGSNSAEEVWKRAKRLIAVPVGG